MKNNLSHTNITMLNKCHDERRRGQDSLWGGKLHGESVHLVLFVCGCVCVHALTQADVSYVRGNNSSER